MRDREDRIVFEVRATETVEEDDAGKSGHVVVRSRRSEADVAGSKKQG